MGRDFFQDLGEAILIGVGQRALWLADVAMDARSGGAEAIYTYAASPDISVGDAVIVPLGARTVLGFVVRVYPVSESNLDFPEESLRAVHTKVDGVGLPAPVVEACLFVAEETLCPLSVALTAAIPPGLKSRLTKSWVAIDGVEATTKLSPQADEVLKVLRESGFIVEKAGKKIPPGTAKILKSLRAQGLVRDELRVDLQGERRVAPNLLRLTENRDRVDEFLLREGRRKPAQALTLMRLQEGEHAQLTAPELRALAGVTETTIKALLDAGLLERVDEGTTPSHRAPVLNRHQKLAVDAVAESVTNGDPTVFLLYGVTGSGKTEVYLRAASEALRAGRQVLYLVPEIALATQAISRLRDRFGAGVAILHSELPPAERLRNWIGIRTGEASLVLGARSALFAPLSNLGLIVVDEEHEASYKQESAPRYHAKAVAKFLARRHRCPVILGSATPSLETFYEAERSEDPSSSSAVTLLSLPMRAARAELPTVEIQDLTVGYRHGTPSLITERLRADMEETLRKGEQVILFLNRRSYAPFVICRDCGQRMECPNCAISLSYHRRDRRLRCHHCGFHIRPPDACPSCGGARLTPLGIGTERLEESVAQMFPEARVARLDRDVARRKGALEEVLAAFRAKDLDILVGTQMVAKGLDFPNVTLVGAILADMSLNIPDFRSSERTFQLLCQVAGRSGRGSAPGTVIVQTFNPRHPAVHAAQTHDYLGFYESLLPERREAGYPPFRRLVNVEMRGENQSDVLRAAGEALRRLRPTTRELLGPVDCAIERLNGQWRQHLLLKFLPTASVLAVGEALRGFAPAGVTVTVDVDPYSVM